MMLGGVSKDLKDADEEVQALCDKVRPEVEGKVNGEVKEFTAKKFKTQVSKACFHNSCS